MLRGHIWVLLSISQTDAHLKMRFDQRKIASVELFGHDTSPLLETSYCSCVKTTTTMLSIIAKNV